MTPFLFLPLAGAAAGAAAHYLLTHLRRDVRIHKGWCIGGVAALWTLVAWRATEGNLPWWWLPVPLLVAWLAVPLTVVDLKHRRLPNTLTLTAYPATAAAVTLAATQSGWHTAASALLGATLLGLTYLTVHHLSPSTMGGGDVKLSGTQGAIMGAVGLPAVLVGTTLAALLTLTLNAIVPRHKRHQWQSGIPHAPALLAATYVVATFPTIQAPPT
jgi:leader peptidase (prepilin peptidase) / N-methyltransferase